MQSQLPKTRDLVFTICNMLLLTFEQTFTGGAVRSSEKNDFLAEAHLLAALVASPVGASH